MSYTPALNTILLGAPKAPNPTAGDASQRISTTSFVQSTVTTAISDALTAGDFVGRTTTQTITGAKTFTSLLTANAAIVSNAASPGDVALQVSNSGPNFTVLGNGDTTIDGLLNVTSQGVILGSGAIIDTTQATSGTAFLRASAAGDAHHRFIQRVNGDMLWGPGNATQDVFLTRAAANVLQLDAGDTLRIQQDPVNANDVARKQYIDDQIDAVEASIAAIDYVDLDSAQTISGAKTFSTTTTFSGGSGIVITSGTSAGIQRTGLAASSAIIGGRVSGENSDRFGLSVDGTLGWGGGTTGQDVYLTRLAAGVIGLGAGHQFRIDADPVNANDVTRKSYVDTEISDALAGIDYSNYVTLDGVQTISGSKTFTDATFFDGVGAYLELVDGANIYAEGAMSSDQVFASAVAGDTGDNRFVINAAGQLQWGSGAALVDVNLYRSAADTLKTDDDLHVGQGVYVLGSAGLNFGTGGDAALTRTGAGVIGITGKLQQATLPTQPNDLASKAYVDSQSQGLDQKASVRAASATNIDIATGGLLTVDGVTLSSGDRVLLMGQTDASENGIYAADAGAWLRTSDANSNADVTSGLFTFVTEGTNHGNNGYTLITDDPITLDTTNLEFTQFSGAGQIDAGDGLVKNGNVLDVQGTADRIVANVDSIDIASTYAGQTSINTLGTITTGTWNGTAVAITSGGTGASSLAAAQANLDIVTLTGSQTVTGTKTFTQIIGAAAGINGTGTTGSFNRAVASGDAATHVTLTSRESGEGNARFSLGINGNMEWGTGAAAPDLTLSRTGVGVLELGTGDFLRVSSTPSHNDDVTNKLYVDTAVGAIDLSDYVTLTTNQTIEGIKTFENIVEFTGGNLNLVGAVAIRHDQAAGPQNIVEASELADANFRFQFDNNGAMSWGNGTDALDTNLYRTSVGQLRTDGDLIATDLFAFGDLSVDGTAYFTGDVVVDGAGALRIERTAGNLRALNIGTSTYPTGFGITADGFIEWGVADNDVDVSLGRVAANALGVSSGNQIRVAQDPANANDLARKQYVDNTVSTAVSSGTLQTTTTITTNTTLAGTEKVVLVNGSGAVTVTLPATHTNGQVIHIKDISGNAETNNITIATADADLIDGLDTADIIMNYQNITVVSNGTNWYII